MEKEDAISTTMSTKSPRKISMFEQFWVPKVVEEKKCTKKTGKPFESECYETQKPLTKKTQRSEEIQGICFCCCCLQIKYNSNAGNVKKKHYRRHTNRSCHTDHFSLNAEVTECATEAFNVYGFVEMAPNTAFCEAAQSILDELESEAVNKGETTNSVLLRFVDEGMSTALEEDNLRKMLHASRYVKKGRFTRFFEIMKTLNDLFFVGKRSALNILTSKEAKNYDCDISHESTECLDIISQPPAIDGTRGGATDQHRHLDAMFKHVQCIVFCLFFHLFLLSLFTSPCLLLLGRHYSSFPSVDNMVCFRSRRDRWRSPFSSTYASVSPVWWNHTRTGSQKLRRSHNSVSTFFFLDI